MKTILLIIALLLPATAIAGDYHHRSHYRGAARHYHHGAVYRGYYPSRYYTGYRYISPYRYRPYRHYPRYRGGAFTGPAFDFSAYPTGSYYRADPPGFQYQSITPDATPEGVHTWTDGEGTIHFTDDPGKAPTGRK
ncbi:MAG: hypothetical protein PHG20_00960 [Geobacteraceae bacterium]|nr:hypothetical protein [Geobacteraceae bacterium]